MLRHGLHRGVAALVALGTALALTQLVTPAGASATPSGCDPDYPASVMTTTSLRLARTIGQYGSTNVAFVTVSSDAGVPTGKVTITVSNGSTFHVALNPSGQAQHRLPKSLRARQTYTVAAVYRGTGCYESSVSDPKYYTVVQRNTHMRRTHASHTRKGGRTHVSGRVVAYGRHLNGVLHVRLYHHGLKRHRTVRVHDGWFHASFGGLRGTGTWSVRIYRAATTNFTASRGVSSFTVGHR